MNGDQGGDQNFDDLAELFAGRIYSGSKGRIRLALLERDLLEVLPDLLQPTSGLQVLDAGGGVGQFSQRLALAGHQVYLCDHSARMIAAAKQASIKAGTDSKMSFVHSKIQELDALTRSYDLVLCHAVLEWTQDPEALIDQLLRLLKPGGILSLMFFNLHSTVFRSLVRGYLDKALQGNFRGSGQGLTPVNPLEPHWVLDLLQRREVSVLIKSGIRVFHDYMHKDVRDRRNEDDILELEMRYSRLEPYRSMGRYYHIVAGNSTDT